jgi:light-regulated signal transduction histidine kinase (bacteriophytochrome)
MVYKFHEDQHGEVVAAKSKKGIPSYLGLNWPATDLPQVSPPLPPPAHHAASTRRTQSMVHRCFVLLRLLRRGRGQVTRRLFVEFDAPRINVDFLAQDSVIHMAPSMQGAGPVPIERSELRASVGCHKEYMKNMGQRGSLVSPVVGPRLWS